MKKLLVIYAVSVALVFGISTTAFAKSYTVQKGDTLYLIAKRHNVPFTEVLRLNNKLANPNMIYPNQVIILPDTYSSTPTPPQSDISQQAQEVLQLVNAERKNQGLKPLTLSIKLNEIASVKSKDMAVKNYFSHTSPTYGSPFDMLKHFGVSYRTAGENIAAGQKTPKEVMRAWLNSSGHRANILNPNYTELGVGYYKGGQYGIYWTQLFTGN